MSDAQPETHSSNEPATYEIRLRGCLARRWAEWLGAVDLALEADGVTRLTCSAIDQAALYAVLRKVRDLGLPLLSVTRIETRSDQTRRGASQ